MLTKHCTTLLFLAHIALFAASLYPLLSVNVLPLADFPNHMARAYIIYHQKTLASLYRVHWEVAPYIVMEGLMVLFQSFMDVYQAGKLFVCLALFLIVAGVLAVNRHFYPTYSFATLLVYPYLYNTPLYWGFISYTFGMGCALLSIALWLHFRKNLTPLRLFLFLGVLTFNYFAHIISYGLLCLTLVVYEVFMADKKALRDLLSRLGVMGLLMLPQVLLWLLAPKNMGKMVTEFNTVFTLLYAVFSPVLFNDSFLEIGMMITMVALILIAVLSMETPIKNSLVMLMLLSIMVPVRLWGIFLTNIRMPPFIMLLTLSASKIDLKRSIGYRVIGVAMLVAVAGCGTMRYFSLIHNIEQCGSLIDEFRAALRETLSTHGVAVLTLINKKAELCPLRGNFMNINSLEVIESHNFVPEVFTVIPPVKPSKAFKPLDIPVNEPMDVKDFLQNHNTSRYWRKKGNKFKYIIVLGWDPALGSIPDFWHLAHHGSFFDIYTNSLFTGQ